jgi:hypothetical protein
VIQVRCTAEEFALIHARAERSGMYASGFLRTLAVGTPGPRAVKRTPADRKELARVLGELGKCGSNLNQLARAFNRGRTPLDEDLALALRAFTAMRADVRRALGLKP